MEGLRGMVLCDGRLLLQLISQNSPLRPALEAFIRSAFQIHFDAQVGSLMPHLVGLYGVNGEIEAAVGLRSAARGALFLEQYLDDPIERIIGGRTGGVVERAAVVSEQPSGASGKRGGCRSGGSCR